MLSIVFFGSFKNYSVQVLDALVIAGFPILGVITTPPAPKGRHLELSKTEVQTYSETHNIPVFPVSSFDTYPPISQPDFLVVAGFGKLIPPTWLFWPKIMPVNFHPSLLPKYPGRCPAEWAILNAETETGVTLIRMTEKFDAGDILVQKPLSIEPDDTRETLYQKLFTLGGKVLVEALPDIAAGKITPFPQPAGQHFYARQITREDGFVEYYCFLKALQGMQSELAQRNRSSETRTGSSSKRDCIPERLIIKFRAFAGWPGVWTTNPSGQRLKLFSLSPR